MGYIAVSNDETTKRLGRRDITIAWRGTVTRLEWIADLKDFLKPISADKIPCPDQEVKVESGFVDLYTDKDETCKFCKLSAREQILAELKRLVDKFQNEELSITITGHSLGGALAILSAYDIAETGIHAKVDTSTILEKFKEILKQSSTKFVAFFTSTPKINRNTKRSGIQQDL